MKAQRSSICFFVIFSIFSCSYHSFAANNSLPAILYLLLSSEDIVTQLVIAESGGTLTLKSGVSITIPPNALSEDTTVTLTSVTASQFDGDPSGGGVANLHLLGAVFEPKGTAFNIPATIRFPLPKDWSVDNELVVSSTNGNYPGDMMETTDEVVITGSPGNYVGAIQTFHFSAIGLSRVCHSGTYRRVVQAFDNQGCYESLIRKQVEETYSGVKIDDADAELMDEGVIQPFLATYFQEYKQGGFHAGDLLSDKDFDYLRDLTNEGLQVVIGFNTSNTWPSKEADGFHNHLPHSAYLQPDGPVQHTISYAAYDRSAEKVSFFEKMQRAMEENGTVSYPDPINNINSFRQRPNGEAMKAYLANTQFNGWPTGDWAGKKWEAWNGVFTEDELNNVTITPASYSSMQIYIDRRSNSSQNPCDCTLTLSPEKAFPEADIAANLFLPQAMIQKNKVSSIECNSGNSSFNMPPPELNNNVSVNSLAFKIPPDSTAGPITATCHVKGVAGDICNPSANVTIEILPGSCASQGFPGPETIVRNTLEWQRCPLEQTFSIPGAEAYCQNLELNGHDDWHWPTKAELKSLVYCSNGKQIPLLDWEDVIPQPVTWDEASCCMSFDGNGNCVNRDWTNPTISDDFEGEGDDYYSYFTSEIFPENDSSGEDKPWVVEFFNGGVARPDWHPNGDPDNGYNVRCVRSVVVE